MATETLNRINKLMSEQVGVAMTVNDLDMDNPADAMLYEIANRWTSTYEKVTRHAATIVADMQRVLNGQTPETLMGTSTGRNYEAAVSALDALRGPLQVAVGLYKQAHALGTAA